MDRRYGLYAALAALASATVLLTGAGPAAGATSAGWHLISYADPCGQTPLKVAATSPQSAWMMGAGFPNGGQCPADGIDVSHWNGSAWTLLPATTALADQTGSNGAIAASSSANVWVFPLLGTGTTVYAAAENWNGSTWTDFSLPDQMLVQYAVTFGRSAAWAFGPRPFGAGPHLNVAAYFNGSSWQRAPLPGEPLDESALAANDIWAVGPSAKTAAKKPSQQVTIAMHWNGKQWQTLATPRIRVGKGEQALVNGVVALGPKNFWWSYVLLASSGQARPGGQMLHWNGRRWSQVRVPTAGVQVGGGVITEDGDGGVWLEMTATKDGVATTLAYHYSAAGRWSHSVLPIPKGYNSTSLSLFWIPHSRSVWAVGYAHASTNAQVGIIERYTAP